ncbi:formimidoylglutamate deiminase [Thalassotalea piscium]|uniref:Formimidoylglutamate deiminase n=1 Tax=Thalassotalea piscium TaxID=1230533 RepID=A0A7X0TT39_9GAMM|nr:formimidoylglutamate deiminase [Thalassotalea piscium]MBB6542806.1 formimidoylglutamate deiminase [Thalassotalea piscium]
MKIFAERVLLSEGWKSKQTLTIENGIIISITSGKDESAECVGTVIPGMVNCHSHAFQRAFAGFSEQGSDGQDSFWTWRNVMYQFLANLTAEDAKTIATQLYIEMLKSGYTRVAEFHYLHHDINGQPYSNLATMAEAIFEASEQSGIGLTLLPVLYQYSGFGQLPPNAGQKRFINQTNTFNNLVSDCYQLSQKFGNTNVGIAPHSLRAVDKSSLQDAVAHIRALDSEAPIHIHIAEQQKEVDDCLNYYQQRPVQWLLNNFQLDPQWCLIHATHINEQERDDLIATKAIAGICPTTEANLGDGIFPTAEFLAQGGTIAIGSDSHISVNPVEELRWLEYAQRLIKQQRALLATLEQPSVGQYLWAHTAKIGAQSTNSNTGELAVGKQADLLVLDENKLSLFAARDAHVLDSLIFATQNNVISDVMVNGKWCIRNGAHAIEQQASAAFAQLLKQVSQSL